MMGVLAGVWRVYLGVVAVGPLEAGGLEAQHVCEGCVLALFQPAIFSCYANHGDRSHTTTEDEHVPSKEMFPGMMLALYVCSGRCRGCSSWSVLTKQPQAEGAV